MRKHLLTIVTLLLVVAQGALADVWDGKTYTQPEFVDQKSSDFGPDLYNVFKIRSAAELAWVQANFCETITMYAGTDHEKKVTVRGATFELLSDIDMGDAVSWRALGNEYSSTFQGLFVGNNHTIRLHTFGEEDNYHGLFMRVGTNGAVRNLRVSGTIACSNSRLVGGIAGENRGKIENCWVSADVSSGWRNSLSAMTAKIGGIAGENSGRISYCCVTGNVTNDDADVGGIVGYNTGDGVVEHVTFYGMRSSAHSQDNVYVGDNSGSLSNMYTEFSDDELSAYLSNVSTSEGLYREAVESPFTVTINNEGNGALTASLSKTRPGKSVTLTPTAGSNLLRIVVKDADGRMMNYWNDLTETRYSFEMPQRDVVVTAFKAAWAGSGTAEDPYLISDAGDWEMIHTLMMNNEMDNCFSGTYFKQTANINTTQGIGVTGQHHEKAFSGIYDGDGYTLACNMVNPVANSTECVAPFHRLNNATVKNLHVKGKISGGLHSAGLAALTNGTVTIENCRVSADVSCTGTSVNGAHGGGIVGHANESTLTVRECLFDGSLTASANDGNDTYLGAIIGWGGTTTKVSMCMENATFTTTGKTAFCWKSPTSTAINDYYGNRYFSNFSEVSGVDKLYTVSSGTEDFEIVLPDKAYDWQEAYHGAIFRATSDYATVYIIGGKYYTIESSVIQFATEYPEVWRDVVVYNGETQMTMYSATGLYSFRQGKANTVITATYKYNSWTDEGNYATAFTTVDNKDKTVTISTPEELARLAKLVYDGEDSGNGWKYLLNADLDMSGKAWTPIGKGLTNRFRGMFDGQGHTISGINVPGTDQYAGLFGVVNGTVKNLKLANSQIQGRRYVGGIAGGARFDIVNCHVGDDVTVKAVVTDDSYSGQDCGGVVGYVQNQDARDGFSATDAWIRGCYSTATVSGKAHVGGIAGNLASGTVHYCISQAKATATGDDGTVAYVIGNQSGGNSLHNFYIADTESGNSTDVRAYHVYLSEDLKEAGYRIDHGQPDEFFEQRGLSFWVAHANNKEFVYQLKVGDEWYSPKTYTIDQTQHSSGFKVQFYFTIPSKFAGTQATNIKVNGVAPKQVYESADLCFGITEDAEITATPVIAINDNADNSELLAAFKGKKVNVKLEGRTFYRDGRWNTICLPFDLACKAEDSPIKDGTVKELLSSDFADNQLTLNFSKGYINYMYVGQPYIIKWDNSEGGNLTNLVFEDVRISTDTPVDDTPDNGYVTFKGNFSPVTLEANNKSVLFMGSNGDNKSVLYYPAETTTIGSCRAYFTLNGIVAGDKVEGVRLFFGDDDEATGISSLQSIPVMEESGCYTLDGRRLSGKPTQKGLYIINGKKTIIK